MRTRKGIISYMHKFEAKWTVIGIAIGLALGYLEWEQNMDLIGTVMSLLPV